MINHYGICLLVTLAVGTIAISHWFFVGLVIVLVLSGLQEMWEN